MPFAGFSSFVLPCLLITVMLMLFAKMIDLRWAFYRRQVDEEITGKRLHSIDGLRGFLAVFVMYHHAVITYFFYSTGKWSTPPSRLSTLFGQGGVAMFFMVTALLFWSRALAANGRMDLQRFFWSRLMRIVPMYLVAAFALIFTALALTHFRLNDTPAHVLKDAAAWILFTFPGTPNLNGLHNTGLINTVFWSLVYEWKFYLLFPLMLFFARGHGSWILLLVSAVLVHWYSVSNVEWYFVYGALTATILTKFPATKKFFAGPAGSLLVVMLLGLIFVSTPTAYSPGAAPLFFAVFFVIACGNTMFGILTCRPARLLGTISYSVYLMHNFWLYLAFRLVNHYAAVPSIPISLYWSLTGVVALFVIGTSAMTYRFVEFPFLKAKSRVLFGVETGKASPAAIR